MRCRTAIALTMPVAAVAGILFWLGLLLAIAAGQPRPQAGPDQSTPAPAPVKPVQEASQKTQAPAPPVSQPARPRTRRPATRRHSTKPAYTPHSGKAEMELFAERLLVP